MTVKKSHITRLHLLKNGQQLATSDPMAGERRTAMEDLLQHSYFQPRNDNHGPYEITLSIEENRLVIALHNIKHEALQTLVLSLKPYKRLIHDYFLMIESYESARHNLSREKLEAIDMGRRGLHNEGAELLMSRLADKIDMDMNTARRIFTLICVLHHKQMKMLR